MKVSSDIKPVSYLKSNAADILKQINETHRPIVITQNGEPRGVLQDPETYDSMKKAIGIDVVPVLGSRATYLPAELGGVAGRAVRPGDVLCALPTRNSVTVERRWPEEHLPRHEDNVTVRVIWGPQDDYFTPKARETLMSEAYEVTVSSDRWGCRLDGPSLEHSGESEIVSDGMMLGAIQVPPNGKPIVMLADRATTGGYPKIATVIGPDVAKLGQLMPGGRVRFQSVGIESALSAAREQRRLEEKIARDLGA